MSNINSNRNLYNIKTSDTSKKLNAPILNCIYSYRNERKHPKMTCKLVDLIVYITNHIRAHTGRHQGISTKHRIG